MLPLKQKAGMLGYLCCEHIYRTNGEMLWECTARIGSRWNEDCGGIFVKEFILRQEILLLATYFASWQGLEMMQ